MADRDRVSENRNRLRAMGLRPVQAWVPDVRSAGFADEARRQARLVVQSAEHSDDMDFFEAVSAQWED